MPVRTLRFQQKLWQIVNGCQSGAVSWSLSGNSVIFKFQQFKREYLERDIKFCKSKKLASFVRQLNLYGFRKLVKTGGGSRQRFQDVHEFQNVFFQRGRKDLLEFVIRSSTTPALTRKPRSKFEHVHCTLKRTRGKKSRGKRIKCEKIDVDDVDHCYGKINTYQNATIPALVKKEPPCSPDENPVSNFSNTENKSKKGKEICIYPEEMNQRVYGDKQTRSEKANCKEEECKENINPKKKENPSRKKWNKPRKHFANLDDNFTVVGEEEIEEEDEFYMNLVIDSYIQSYLDEPVLFEEKNGSSSGLNGSSELRYCCDSDGTEEYLELKQAFERMNCPSQPGFCICNPNIAPRWMMATFP